LEEAEMEQKICPNCGCFVGGNVGFEQDELVYCCEPCATGERLCTCQAEEVAKEE
jgi:hypothetical protein